MRPEILRFFVGTKGGFLFRIYVTNIDLLCVRMSRDAMPTPRGGGGLAGAAAQASYEEALQQFNRQVEEEGQRLAQRGEEGIRIFIKANKRGYELDPDHLSEVRLDYVGKWKRFFFLSPNPAFIVRTAREKLTFLLPQKKDVVIALHELQLLLGDNLEVGLRRDDYKKALKKYAQMRGS